MTDASPDRLLTPDYSRPEARRGLDVRLYGTAVVCGALPMAAGVGITFLFWLTRSPVLPMLGMFVVLGGFLMFLIGCVALATFASRAWHHDRETHRAWRGRIGLAFLLLCANFPAARACGMAVEYFTSIYGVTVRNVGPTRIDSFRIWWADGLRELGPIPPGGTAAAKFSVDIGGPLEFREARGSAVRTALLARNIARWEGRTFLVTSTDGAMVVNGTRIKPSVVAGPANPATAPIQNK